MIQVLSLAIKCIPTLYSIKQLILNTSIINRENPVFNIFTYACTSFAWPLPSPSRVNTHINTSARGRVLQSRGQRHFVLQAEVR